MDQKTNDSFIDTLMSQRTIKEFISTFNFLISFNCFEAIDQMFLKLIEEDWSKESIETNQELIVIFCRTNYTIRNKLNYYKPFINKALNYGKQHNLDISELLIGIL